MQKSAEGEEERLRESSEGGSEVKLFVLSTLQACQYEAAMMDSQIVKAGPGGKGLCREGGQAVAVQISGRSQTNRVNNSCLLEFVASMAVS